MWGQPLLRLETILRGIRKHCSQPTLVRLPITAPILQGIYTLLHSGVFGPYLDLLFKTVCLTAFFAFLRCGEFTCKSRFDPGSNFCIKDVEFVHTCAQTALVLNLKASKTDPFRLGCRIYIFRNKPDFCPVKSMIRYLDVRHNMGAKPSDPLFVTSNNQVLTRTFFIEHLRVLLSRLGVNPYLYGGHSFRSGAATSSAKAHVADHLIKTLGRWSSSCYQRSIDTPIELLIEAQHNMALG
jgi:hypothetical protein